MHIRLVTFLLAGGIAAACPGPTAAQPVNTQADLLFEQGRDLLTAGKYAEACAAFDASQELEPSVSTRLNQANCREKNGQLATAWRLFVDTERQTRTAADASTRKLHGITVAHASRLGARLSTLTIQVPQDRRVGGLEILRHGVRVEPDAWNAAVPVDGGTYTITARAPGRADWSITVTVGVERDLRIVEVPRLAPVVTAPAPAPARPAAVPSEPTPGVHHRSILPPALAAGGAVVLLGGAAGFARWADLTYDRAKAAPGGAAQTSLWHAANRKRYAAGAMLGAGIGLAGVALWLRLRGRTESPSAAAPRNGAVTVAPLVHADLVGLEFGRSW